MVSVVPRIGGLALAALVVVKLLLHLSLSHRYGYHGDELYFIECGKHWATGYVDQAPVIPWLARLSGALFGYALWSLRLLPAVAGACTLGLTVLLVRRFGGGRLAEVIAGLAMLIAPAYLQMASLLHLLVFETLFWTAATYLVVRVIEQNRPCLWLLIGLVVGLGLLTKHTMMLWGGGLVVGLLLTEHRRLLSSPWPWLGLLVAGAVFLPNLIWQAHHEWATVQFIENARRGMLAEVPRVLFLLGQVLYMHPLGMPIWILGVVFLARDSGARFRLLAVQFLVVLCVLLATRGKPYYLAPAYPPLFAAGAVYLEPFLGPSRKRVVALVVGLLLGGVFTAPFALPLLPLPVADRIVARVLGFVVDDPRLITGDFHREFGWREQADTVAEVYRGLSPELQAETTILTHDYSQASAVNFFGAPLGLPRAVSGHMTYYFWGPPSSPISTVIAYGMPRASLEPLCGDIQRKGTTHHPLALPRDNDLPVYVCRSLKRPLSEHWPRLKRFRHVEPSTTND